MPSPHQALHRPGVQRGRLGPGRHPAPLLHHHRAHPVPRQLTRHQQPHRPPAHDHHLRPHVTRHPRPPPSRPGPRPPSTAPAADGTPKPGTGGHRRAPEHTGRPEHRSTVRRRKQGAGAETATATEGEGGGGRRRTASRAAPCSARHGLSPSALPFSRLQPACQFCLCQPSYGFSRLLPARPGTGSAGPGGPSQGCGRRQNIPGGRFFAMGSGEPSGRGAGRASRERRARAGARVRDGGRPRAGAGSSATGAPAGGRGLFPPGHAVRGHVRSGGMQSGGRTSPVGGRLPGRADRAGTREEEGGLVQGGQPPGGRHREDTPRGTGRRPGPGSGGRSRAPQPGSRGPGVGSRDSEPEPGPGGQDPGSRGPGAGGATEGARRARPGGRAGARGSGRAGGEPGEVRPGGR